MIATMLCRTVEDYEMVEHCLRCNCSYCLKQSWSKVRKYRKADKPFVFEIRHINKSDCLNLGGVSFCFEKAFIESSKPSVGGRVGV